MYWRSNESDLWLEYEREEQSEDDEMSERNEMIAESVNLSCDQNTNLNVDQVVLDDALELKMCYCWRKVNIAAHSLPLLLILCLLS